MREWILIETHAPSLQIHFSSKALVGENVNSELLWEWGELRCCSHLLLVLIYYNSLSAYLHRGTFIQLFVKCLVIQPLDYFSVTAEVKLHLTQLHWFSRQVNLQAALTENWPKVKKLWEVSYQVTVHMTPLYKQHVALCSYSILGKSSWAELCWKEEKSSQNSCFLCTC